MRLGEIRQQARLERIAAGDERSFLLAATPAENRSEVAARYDHRTERSTLTVESFSEAARAVLVGARRTQAMIDGYESGEIRIRRETLMARVSCGLLPAHVEAVIKDNLDRMPPITDAEILGLSQGMLANRLDYLRRRYGATE